MTRMETWAFESLICCEVLKTEAQTVQFGHRTRRNLIVS